MKVRYVFIDRRPTDKDGMFTRKLKKGQGKRIEKVADGEGIVYWWVEAWDRLRRKTTSEYPWFQIK